MKSKKWEELMFEKEVEKPKEEKVEEKKVQEVKEKPWINKQCKKPLVF